MSHKFSHEKQKRYFNFAYQTGSDIWTHIPYQYLAQTILPHLPKDSLVLDIGSGRGLWLMKLLERNYQVLGIDYVSSVVDFTNKQILEKGYLGRGKCLVADTLDIPFTEKSFPLVTDIGTFQHIYMNDWDVYVKEVHRVLKKNGYYLNVSHSSDTHQFQGFFPNTTSNCEFYKFGVYYHFFSKSKIKKIFENYFEIIDQQVKTFESQSDPHDDIALIFTLMKKRQLQ